MRVLISVQNYRPAYSFGGRVGNAAALAEGLHRLGYEVMVVTSSVVDRQRRPALRTRRDCINGVSVTYLGTWLRIGNVSLNPAVLGFAASEISRFDAVHIIGLYDALGPAIAFSARRNGIPYSVEPSGMTIPIVRSLRLKRVYHALFGYSMLMGARAIVVTSKVEWDEALGFGIPPEKLVIRHNGIDLEAYKSPPKRGLFRRRFGIPECTPMVLWLGRIEAKKNLEGLLEALSGLKGLPWTLVIAGPSESQDYLRALHRLSYTMGIEERVRFVPGLYGEDKLSAFLDADLFVLVSINENWGNTVLEAIALGVPVLVTRTCGVAEVVEGRAGLVVDLDVSAIRDGLKRLLTDSDLY
ncbi:MAG TPA: glycosyltransferase, partial [Thermodesulfobacteriota bacterium]|nr:glycosyltransferase [Thermodesulfobacteriota bacterium]